jgi:hypothetical protein
LPAPSSQASPGSTTPSPQTAPAPVELLPVSPCEVVGGSVVDGSAVVDGNIVVPPEVLATPVLEPASLVPVVFVVLPVPSSLQPVVTNTSPSAAPIFHPMRTIAG